MSGEGFGCVFLKSVEICFCFNNMRKNVGIDTKLLDYLLQFFLMNSTERLFLCD